MRLGLFPALTRSDDWASVHILLTGSASMVLPGGQRCWQPSPLVSPGRPVTTLGRAEGCVGRGVPSATPCRGRCPFARLLPTEYPQRPTQGPTPSARREQSPSLGTVHRPRCGFRLLEGHHPEPPPQQPRLARGQESGRHVQRRARDGRREARGALAGLQPPRTHCGRRADGCWLPESRRSLSPGGILLSASQVPRSVCECRTPPRANTLYKPLAGQMPMRAEEEGAVRGARAALAERMLGAAFQRGLEELSGAEAETGEGLWEGSRLLSVDAEQ